MAVLSAIFAFSAEKPQKVTALAAATSSAEIVIGKDRKIAIVCTANGAQVAQSFTIAFGTAGMAAADATNMAIPLNTIAVFTMGNAADRIRVFNLGAAAADIWIQPLSN